MYAAAEQMPTRRVDVTERSATVRDVMRAIRLLALRPGRSVYVFERDWSRVDTSRAEVFARGLDGRVCVHHVSAMTLPGARARVA